MKFKPLVLFTSLFVLCSCQNNNVFSIKHYLSYKYKLEDCADIHGQDNYKNIWFNDYGGTSYAHLFNLEESYLDMKVVIEDSRAKGVGELKLTRKDDYEKSTYLNFEYYCSLTDTTGGVVKSTLDEKYSSFVFCVYWCRVNVRYINPEDECEFTLTLHFRGGTPNSYPPEFNN